MPQPGIHDFNAAQSAVASKYIEQCSGLWVVAPITRAVDDKAAQTLLGDAFRSELQFDGNYSRVTVICSKTDDINVAEALKVMPEEEPIHEYHDRAHRLETERKDVEGKARSLKVEVEMHGKAIEDQFKEIRSLKAAIRRASDENETLVVSPSPRKWASQDSAPEARKRPQLSGARVQDDTDSDQSTDLVDSETEVKVDEGKEISKEDAEKRLEDLESRYAVMTQERKEMNRRLRRLNRELKPLKSEIKSLNSQAKRACVQSRNSYARPEIQAQFADGIRE